VISQIIELQWEKFMTDYIQPPIWKPPALPLGSGYMREVVEC